MADNDPFGLNRALFMLTDPDVPAAEATDRAWAGIRGGASHVLVRRPKDAPAKVFQIATTLCPRFREDARWRVLVHERADIAITTFSHGSVHPLNGIPGVPAKGLLGADRMMGISVHSLGQAQNAQLQHADFVLFGNVYETESHPGKSGEGLDALAHVVKNIAIPVIAIGGITAERVDDVLAAGASGVAVIRAISRAGDPEAAARSLRDALDAATHRHLT